jgi:hypothetical protein
VKQPLVMSALVFILVSTVFWVASKANAAETDPFPILREERIGDFRIGMPEAEVKRKIDFPLRRGKEILEGATGAYVEEWVYPMLGLRLKMSSERKKGPKLIANISITSPSTLRTKRNMHVGSTEQEVIEAYGDTQDEDARSDSEQGKSFVVGSIYGGLIFNFTNGRVSQIFLGAAAE